MVPENTCTSWGTVTIRDNIGWIQEGGLAFIFQPAAPLSVWSLAALDVSGDAQGSAKYPLGLRSMLNHASTTSCSPFSRAAAYLALGVAAARRRTVDPWRGVAAHNSQSTVGAAPTEPGLAAPWHSADAERFKKPVLYP
jgi:hypothetical protein